jgi:hypothetical protein
VNNVRSGALSVSGGTIVIQSNGGDSGASRVGTLSFAGGAGAPTASMDLNDNDLIVTATTAADVQSLIAAGRNGGPWDGQGLTSAAARADGATTLGVLRGTEWIAINGAAPFDGFAVASSDVLVKYTWHGDADFNGEVNFDDYVRIDGGFNGGLTGWLNGDFDHSGAVDFDDYVLIDLGFNAQDGTLRRALSFLSGEDRSLRGMDEPSLQLVAQHLDMFGTRFADRFLSVVPEPGACALNAVVCLTASLRRRRFSNQ